MLVLSRRINEILLIGKEVQLKVLEIKGNQVRFGIAAPKYINVSRKEIYDRVKDEQNLHRITSTSFE